MEKYIKKVEAESICLSILLIILGIFMVGKTSVTTSVLIACLGYILVVDGIIHIISYFSMDNVYRVFNYELAQATMDIILGFLLITNTNSFLEILPICIGVWIVVDGIMKGQIAFNIRGISNWGIMFVMALVSIALGVGIIFNPATSMDVIVKLCGCGLILEQMINIYDSVYILQRVDDVSDAIKDAKSAEKVDSDKKD